jgi:capsule polysaccharide export protein KpsE/RkpR
VKQTVGAEDTVRQLQMEVVEPGNGAREHLIEAPRQGGFDWAWLLWLKRGTVGRWTFCGIVLATIIALVIPKQYESTAQLMPPDMSSGGGLGMMAAMARGAADGGGGLGGVALGGLAGGLLGAHDSSAVWSDMLMSRTLQDRIIERFDLRKVYGVRYWEPARKLLTASTQISIDRKSGVLTVVVTDRDQRRAQQMAQAYVEELDRLVALVSTSAARRERIFLEQRLQQVKHDLDDASNQFAQYASKNTVVDVTSQAKAMVDSAAALQGQLIATQSELDGLQQIYTGSNVRVRALRARVDELRSELQKMGGNNANVDSTAPSSPQAQSDQLYPSIRKLPLLGVRWLDLFRETKIQETVYELLTERYEVAKIEEAKEIPTVKVLDAPNWPETKSSPHRMLIVLVGMLLSFSAGVVWVFGTAAWHHMDPEDPRKQLAQEIASRWNTVWFRWTGRFPVVRKAGTWWKQRKAKFEGLHND